ncbi:hypothetical protein DI09_40p70 [Mitosporidium daphniae]|uniref:BZIP domain-containing protein n=1 Tax=Mitosporidium daphniae TaxID=1485682 RepID=A0A098VU37_9MICR|nr:uncharacterized protein DI09_40p70 [Mitosporidium daphniae]KGG51221.1 hypothetical protein DI09_40p70 [Mitosporidium daphniae]|eukprot:XP_013237666.1 uncharacterized protein DI09_40p70 [Mitosporidium daphniae]
MYSCSDILSTETVFDEEEEPFEGEEYFDDYVPTNADEDQSSISSHRSLHNFSPAESSLAASMTKTGHEAQSIASSIDLNHTLPFSGNSNGLGFVYSSSSAGTEDNGIPIANGRRMANVGPNGAFMATSPSPSSPPVFFSLPSPSQFSQVHQQFFDQPQNHHHLLRVFSSPSQNDFATDEAQNFGSPPLPSQYEASQIPNFGRNRGGPDAYHIPYPQHLHEEDHYKEDDSSYVDEPEADPRHLHVHSDINFHRADSVRRSHSHIPYEGAYSIPSSYRHHHMYPSSPHFEEYYSSNSGHNSSNGNGTTSAPSSPTMSGTAPTQNAPSKKERNRLAAERCRKKKQDLISSLSRENKLLYQGNIELTRANHYLEQKLDYLINMLISMDPTQGVLLQDIRKNAPSPTTCFYMDSSLPAHSVSIETSSSPTSQYSNSWGSYPGNNSQMNSRSGAVSASPITAVPMRSSPSLQYLSHDSMGYEYKADPKQNMGSSVSLSLVPPQPK